MAGTRDKVILAAIIGGGFAIAAAIVGVLLNHYISATRSTVAQTSQSAIPAGTKTINSSTSSSDKMNKASPSSVDRLRDQITSFSDKMNQASPSAELRLCEKARKKSGVRALDVVENELGLSAAPRSVYGFAHVNKFSCFSDSLILCRKNGGYLWEFHKMQDASVRIIAFVSSDVAAMIQREDRPSGFRATIYNFMWSNAPVLVSLPLVLLNRDKCNTRNIELSDEETVQALDIIFN